MKQLATLIFIVLFAASCTKEEPEELTVLAPSFSVTGTLNGAPFDFSPGGNGRYLFTRSSTLSGGRALFEAEIASFDGSSQEALSFRIHFDNAMGAPLIDRFNSLSVGEQSLALNSSNLQMEFSTIDGSQVQFTQGGNAETATSFTIGLDDLGGPVFIGGAAPQCFSNSIIAQFIPFIGCDPAYQWGTVVRTFDQEGFATLFPPAFTSAYAEIEWVIDDVVYTQPGGIPLVVASDEDNGMSVELYTDALFGGQVPFLIQQFIPFFEELCELPPMEGYLIGSYAPVLELCYTSPAGVRYSSLTDCSGPSQSPNAHFTVLGTEDYAPNENGEATFSVDFSTELMLYPVSANPGLPPLNLVLNTSSIAFAVE